MLKSSNIVTLSNKVIRIITITYSHKNILAFIGLLPVLISGCSTYEQDFDCPPGVGMGCVSISEVNSTIENSQSQETTNHSLVVGKIEAEDTIKDSCPTCKLQNNTSVIGTPLPAIKGDKLLTNNEPNLSERIHRTRERTARIWVAPYEDEEGDFWEEGYVHVLLKPSQWKNEGIR